MPQPQTVAKAELREIVWGDDQQAREVNPNNPVVVQFNPETLKVAFANQKAGGDQRGGSAVQFVGRGTTKLTLELWFDVTAPLPQGTAPPEGGAQPVRDVRRLTKRVADFITPKKVQGEQDKWIPPGVRFLWGTFLFDGVMDSINETLEYFSNDGRPLRASVSISITKQEIQFQFGAERPPGANGAPTPGTQPQQPARAGDTVQKIAGRAGRPNDWKAIAAANNIENPRQPGTGTLLNTNVRGR
jgi:hypothetical protein